MTFQRIDEDADVDELAGPKLALFVREFGFEADRAGLLIDLIVDDLKRAGIKFGLAVGRKGLRRQLTLGNRLVTPVNPAAAM